MTTSKAEDVEVGMRVKFNYDKRFEVVGTVIINRYVVEKFIIIVDDWHDYECYVGSPNLLNKDDIKNYFKNSDMCQDIEAYIGKPYIMVYYNEFVDIID